MMQMRDWVSGAVGIVLFILGLSVFWGKLSFLKDLIPNTILRWVVLIAGLYLAWNSIVEITNSNVVGWFSFGVAAVSLIIGALPFFGMEVFSALVYQLVLIAQGLFLMIATFAMEL
ncbi:MAG TPA: hypothetical protein VI564_02110 [Candidatus Nanoarchaeia archaeon]|nr:hypothetical protein [Candidatus Nanoarchaeia archaeon]